MRARRSSRRQLNAETWEAFLARRTQYQPDPPRGVDVTAGVLGPYLASIIPPGTFQPRWMHYIRRDLPWIGN